MLLDVPQGGGPQLADPCGRLAARALLALRPAPRGGEAERVAVIELAVLLLDPCRPAAGVLWAFGAQLCVVAVEVRGVVGGVELQAPAGEEAGVRLEETAEHAVALV